MMKVINQQTLTIYTKKLDKLVSDLDYEIVNSKNKYTKEELSEINRLINNLKRFRVITKIHSHQAIAALSLLNKQDNKNTIEDAESIIKELTQEALKLKESITEIQKKLALRKENEFLFSMITGISTLIVAPILFISLALLLGPLAYLPLTMVMLLLAPLPIPLITPVACVIVPYFLSYLITCIFLDEPSDPVAEKLLLKQQKELDSKEEVLQLIKSTSINLVSKNVATSIHGFFNSSESEKQTSVSPVFEKPSGTSKSPTYI